VGVRRKGDEVPTSHYRPTQFGGGFSLSSQTRGGELALGGRSSEKIRDAEAVGWTGEGRKLTAGRGRAQKKGGGWDASGLGRTQGLPPSRSAQKIGGGRTGLPTYKKKKEESGKRKRKDTNHKRIGKLFLPPSGSV